MCCSRIRAKTALIRLLRALLAHFFTCNFWHQLKSLTIPEAIRHPTRETQEHRVTNTHFAAAPSAYGCSCRMCEFLGRMMLLKKTAPIKFLCWCWLWFAKRRDLVAFLRCKHTHRNGGVRDVHVLICTRVVQIGVALFAPITYVCRTPSPNSFSVSSNPQFSANLQCSLKPSK